MADPAPFTIDIPDADLDDLRRRIEQTRWPDAEVVDDWSQGMPLAYAQEMAAYWLDEYDWREREAYHNRLPQFLSTVDGIDVHFIHVRSQHENARPLIISHGWPGSVVEFHKVIEPLADPTSHGGSADEAFHVVCPSLVGYGFSGAAASPGYGVSAMGDTWAALMASLGYDRYFAQGGDWGSMITTMISLQDPDHCAGIHLNMPVAGPDSDTFGDLTDTESAALERLTYYDQWDSGYFKQQSTRPQTLGYGLADSPVGQMCWIVEKFWSWMDCGGHPENVVTRDELLDNVMFYWLTNTATSSARLYWESARNTELGEVPGPTACSRFPLEILATSRRWAEKRFTDIRYWNDLETGGHFAAFEQPETFVAEMRAAFAAIDGTS